MRYYDLIETPKTQKTFLEDGPNRLPQDDPLVSCWFEEVPEGKMRNFSEEGYPIIVDKPPYVEPEPTDAELKLQGVEFEGVMCSATSDDFQGLGVAYEWLKQAGNQTVWEFDNGNELLLGSHNIDAFYAVWFPFRMSFFKSS